MALQWNSQTDNLALSGDLLAWGPSDQCCWIEAYRCLDDSPTGLAKRFADITLTHVYKIGPEGSDGMCVYFDGPTASCLGAWEDAGEISQFLNCDQCYEDPGNPGDEPEGEEDPDCGDDYVITFTVTSRLNNPPFTQQCQENGTSDSAGGRADDDDACAGWMGLTCFGPDEDGITSWVLTANTGGGNAGSGFQVRNPNGAWPDMSFVAGLHYTFTNIQVTML